MINMLVKKKRKKEKGKENKKRWGLGLGCIKIGKRSTDLFNRERSGKSSLRLASFH